jgi:Zinc knuckle/Retroviral aspartyl protease
MKDTKTGPYAPKSTSNWSTTRSKKGKESSSAPTAAAASTSTATTVLKNHISRSQKREQGLCFRCGEKGHLIKDCPQPPKTGKAAEINAVGLINSGVDTINLESERRIESGGADRPLTSRGPGSIARPVVRGMFPLKNPANYKSERNGRSYSSVIAGNSVVPSHNPPRNVPGTTVPTISVVPKGETSELSLKRSPPMYTNITIDGVLAQVLLDTGASDDFVATHFVTTNHLPVKRHDIPLAIQQAVRGSKLKSNGTRVHTPYILPIRALTRPENLFSCRISADPSEYQNPYQERLESKLCPCPCRWCTISLAMV